MRTGGDVTKWIGVLCQVAKLRSDGEQAARLLLARDRSITALNREVAEQKAGALQQRKNLAEAQSSRRECVAVCTCTLFGRAVLRSTYA